ncbi:hypothetical protein CspeluHIS016_0200030 [Cutaneotrichosporon spelunceum]|uniref:Uncharacterized protein n=1 Tax=Cutaneotrichosporon spelunceum TaxID=1672016 RepID=A0AAD3TQI0_9TREE|nr:hypothetical protein CspeluHIS016_0200030 [Cutaneotrichosporon spelunceum]
MSATQTEEKKHVDIAPEVHDKPKKTPTKKKIVKKHPQQQPTTESDASSDEDYEQPGLVPQRQVAPQAQLYVPQQSPPQPQPPGQPQELTQLSKKDMVDDAAMQPLRSRKHMISQTIGEQHMKEIQDKRDKEGDEKQSLKIKISLDLDVEVHLSARVKGDITIGLL